MSMKLNCLRCKADVVAEEVQSYNFKEEFEDEYLPQVLNPAIKLYNLCVLPG
jgi:hypothetical protein